MQQPPSHSDKSALQTRHPPKIKPLLRRYYKEKQLNETNYQKSLKMHSKTSRAIKTDADKSRDTSIRYITGYTKELKAQDSLTKLSYSFPSNAFFENRFLSSKIRSFRNLSSLDVQLCFTRRLIPLKTLFRSLGYLKDLTHVKIDLKSYSFIKTDSQTLYILFRSLRRLKNLKSLSLCFVMCSFFKNAKMHLLPQYLSHLKQLQGLEVSFYRSTELNNAFLINLASVLPKLPLLTQISLDFRVQRSALEGSSLVRIFQNLKTPSDITLKLAISKVLKNESADPLAEGLRLLHAPSLKKLNLHLNQNLDSQGPIELFQTIKRFTSLNTLQLNFFDCETFTNDNAVELGSALSSLPELTSFNFKIHHSIEADTVIGCIASGLKSSQNLVNLKLNFTNVKTSPEQIHQLFANLVNLSSLKVLEISFSFTPFLSDDIQNIGEGLMKLAQLKHLELEFSHTNTLTNQDVETLANAVQELHALSTLDLDFNGSQGIDEKSVEKVSDTLRLLPSLYSTQLRFSLCPKLQRNERSFCSLFSALRETKNIREVSLNFHHSESNEQEVNDLKQRKIVNVDWF